MKLRTALALASILGTLAPPLYAQSLPTPNLGPGTKLNGANLQSAATKTTGTSVNDPGTGALEALLPVQTFTATSHTFVTADLYKETRRTNAGTAMADTFPAAGTAGLANGSRMFVNNVDATASDTISAGAGTTLNGASSVVVGALRSSLWVYDAPATTWRSTGNSLGSLLAANNLSEVTSPATARTNIAAAATTTTVTGTGSITGGGDLSANRTLAFAGDGAWPTFTPTITHVSGTAAATESASAEYIKWGTRGYTVTFNYIVTTLGSGSAGFISFTLPNSSTAGSRGAGCSTVDMTTDTNFAGYIPASASVAYINISALAAHAYVMTCTYQSTS